MKTRCDAVIVTLVVVVITGMLGVLNKVDGETLAVLLGAALPSAALSSRRGE